MKSFEVNTKIFFGENALDRLKELDFKKVMVITDPFAVSSGLIDHITARLETANIDYTVYSDVIPDPPIEKVTAGVTAAMDLNPQCIIALGGGSALDLAKSIRKFATKIDPDFNPQLIAIPTTSGTGSEVTPFSVITDPKAGTKYPLASTDMVPDEAILDEVLVKSVPASITADTGMDVMTHAIEAYVSINNNEFSAALAEKAVEICGQFLIRSYNDNNDTHARRKMHIASCLAGLAFSSASLGLNHGMAHQLGAQFHIPHGRANAILLPHIIEYNSHISKYSKSRKEYDKCVQKYCNMARILGVNNLNEVTTIHALLSYVRFMCTEMNIPLSISEIGGISESEYKSKISIMADAALRDGTTATNPRTPTKEEIMQIYNKIW